MRMMPRAAPCASVSMRIVHALCMQVGCTEQGSENGRYWFNSGSQRNNTWLVKTVQYVLSTFELSLDLFLPSWFVWWNGLFAFSFLESPAAFSTHFCT